MSQIERVSIFTSVISAGFLLSGAASAMDTKQHKVGATNVSALLTSSLGYGDNLFRGSDNETSSTFFSLQPLVQAVRETASQRLEFAYEGEGMVFFDSSDDNYLSSKVSGDFVRNLTPNSEFGFGAAYEDGSTIRGTDITEGSNGDLEGATDFTRKDFNLSYRIGSEKIGPSLELGYNFTDLEFDNFELINQGRDYNLDQFTARLGYQYSVATKFFVELSQSDYDYDNRAIAFGDQLDNTEQALLIGISWSLSRLTSGEISVGTIDKEFDNFQDPGSLTAWNVQLDWTPTPRDTITVEGFSRPFEQAGTGLFQDVEQISVEWEHDVSKAISVLGGITKGSVDFGEVQRDDDYDTLKFRVLYKPGRYSEWSLNYEYEEKDSNLPRFNFETNTFFVSYSLSF